MADDIALSVDTVRTLAVVKQGLHCRPSRAGLNDGESLLEAIRRIGLLQLDTVNVVARSHYLVMLSRVGLYDCAELDALLYPARQLFEQWAHAACLIPIEHYPNFAPVIASRRTPVGSDWAANWFGGQAPQEVLDSVLAEIQERGPLGSSDFEDPRARRGTWWDWKPAKIALEVLFEWGELAVDRRVNFQRYYNLAERVLPADLLAHDLTLDDWHRWAALESIRHLGVATAVQASDYYRQKKTPCRAAIQSLVAGGALLPAAVEGWKEPAYVAPEDLPLIEEIRAGDNAEYHPELTTLLSPFDNLIWDRRRVLELFGFDYHIELYTPQSGRRYGYYVMPILHRGRLVGRLDPKADRAARTLLVRAVHLEPGVEVSEDLVAGLAGAIEEFAAFHACETITIERSDPEELRGRLLDRLGL